MFRGYHTGSLAVLRPPSSGERADLPPADEALFEELGQRGAALLEGMDAMTVYEMRREGQPKRDYYGHSLDWTYKSRGCLGMEIELGHVWCGSSCYGWLPGFQVGADDIVLCLQE